MHAHVWEEGAEDAALSPSSISLMWRCFPEPCFPHADDILRHSSSPVRGAAVIPAETMLPGTYTLQV
jgi:hypothetical protein